MMTTAPDSNFLGCRRHPDAPTNIRDGVFGNGRMVAGVIECAACAAEAAQRRADAERNQRLDALMDRLEAFLDRVEPTSP